MPKEKSLILRGFWGFDRTYEELKQNLVDIRHAHCLLGFDRTYEELKQRMAKEIFKYHNWSFDRTYEELKLSRLTGWRQGLTLF